MDCCSSLPRSRFLGCHATEPCVTAQKMVARETNVVGAKTKIEANPTKQKM